MTIPTLEPLAASTGARKWKIDIDISPGQDGTQWRRLMGQTDATLNPGTAGMQNDADYDSGGYQSQVATSLEWNATATVKRAPVRATPTVYDAAQEFVRLAAFKMGTENTVHLRFYEDSGILGPTVEAWEGYAAAVWANSGGDQAALSAATITLNGQGQLLAITHPRNATATPTVASVSPNTAGTAGGSLHRVYGSRFTALTALTVFGNAVPASDRIVVNDGTLVFRAPAHAAGTGDVTVTTAVGTSAVSTNTKITYA